MTDETKETRFPRTAGGGRRIYPNARLQSHWAGDERGFIRDQAGLTVGLMCVGEGGISAIEYGAAAAAPQLYDALKLAQSALNQAPRFNIPGMPSELSDSYKVASVVDAALREAESLQGRPPFGAGVITAVRAIYTFTEIHTGGGCTALRLQFEDGTHVLLTDELNSPTDRSSVVACGIYQNEDDDEGHVRIMAIDEVPRWLAEQWIVHRKAVQS